jgi:hypothetical protein
LQNSPASAWQIEKNADQQRKDSPLNMISTQTEPKDKNIDDSVQMCQDQLKYNSAHSLACSARV